MTSLLLTFVLLAILPLPFAVQGTAPLRRAPATLLIVVVNVALFFATHLTLHGLIEPLGLYDDYGLTPAELRPANLATYAFLHLNTGHLVWNMLFLYLFGPAVEERVGSVLFVALYIAGGAAAGLLHAGIAVHFAGNSSASYEPLVGASGAISGVLGLFATFASRRLLYLVWPAGALLGKGWHLLELPAGVGVLIWLAQTLVGAATTLITADGGGIAYFAHLGGFIFGIGVGLIGGLAHRSSRSEGREPDSPAGAVRQPAAAGIDPALAAPPYTPLAPDVAELLARSIADGDFARAWPLYLKCRTIGANLTADTLDRLERLAAQSGQPEQAAQLRQLAARARTAEGSV